MQYSTNYNMNKPELNEQYRLSHWNDNTDIIDTELKRNADNISNEASRASNAETALQNITNATFKTALLNFCYPIGSLYWSSKSTDPAQLFGGTWTQIKDRFIWAKGDSDTVNTTGGAKTVTLVTNNLPSHSHSFTPSGTVSSHTHSVGAHSHGLNSHTHSFTPNGTVSSHTHSFTPSGTVSSHTHGLNNHTHSFSWSGSHRHKVWGTDRNDSVTCVFLGDINACGIGSSRTKYNVEKYYDNTKLSTSPLIEDTTITVSGTTGGNSENTTSTQPTFTGTAGTTGSSTPTFTGTAGTTGQASGSTANSTAFNSGSTQPTFTGTAGTTGQTGSGTAVDKMPPYIVKYCWERTA